MRIGTTKSQTGRYLYLAVLSSLVLSTTITAARAQTGTADDKAAFDRLDISGNGYLTGPEITPEVRAYNTDGNGNISWEEFAAGRARDRAAGKAPGGVAPARPAPPPARTAASTPAAVRLPVLAARPGYVIGRAVFADGRPIPQFRVTALGWAGEIHLGPVGTLPNLGTLLAKNGQYAIQTTSEIDRKPIRANVLSVQAKAILTHGGKEFQLEMHPTDGKKDGSGPGNFLGDSGKGVVRDFVLRLYGPKRGYETNTPPNASNLNDSRDPGFSAFYGMMVTFGLPGDATLTPEGATLTATFTPTGPLIDGSPARTVVRSLRMQKSSHYYAYFRDIPPANYSVTATVTSPDGSQTPLRLRVLGGDLSASAPLVLDPFYSSGVRDVTILADR